MVRALVGGPGLQRSKPLWRIPTDLLAGGALGFRLPLRCAAVFKMAPLIVLAVRSVTWPLAHSVHRLKAEIVLTAKASLPERQHAKFKWLPISLLVPV